MYYNFSQMKAIALQNELDNYLFSNYDFAAGDDLDAVYKDSNNYNKAELRAQRQRDRIAKKNPELAYKLYNNRVQRLKAADLSGSMNGINRKHGISDNWNKSIRNQSGKSLEDTNNFLRERFHLLNG